MSERRNEGDAVHVLASGWGENLIGSQHLSAAAVSISKCSLAAMTSQECAAAAGKGKASLVRTFAPSVRLARLARPDSEKGEIDVFIISFVERTTPRPSALGAKLAN